jgi:hypothetical protein
MIPRKSTGLQSRDLYARCQLLCLRMNYLPLDITARYIAKYSDRYKLPTARFEVCNTN